MDLQSSLPGIGWHVHLSEQSSSDAQGLRETEVCASNKIDANKMSNNEEKWFDIFISIVAMFSNKYPHYKSLEENAVTLTRYKIGEAYIIITYL